MRPLLYIILSITLIACQVGHHESVKDRIAKATEEIKNPVPEQVLAQHFAPKADTTQYQGNAKKIFLVKHREKFINKFPCSTCHEDGVTTGDKSSHWNIELVHAPKSTMSCKTCHNSDDHMGLYTLQKESVSFNHSYKLCQQCHSPQTHDWAGGAHGKRITGWAQERIVNNCTECHNPHKPAYGKRWPSIQMPDMRKK